MAGNVDTIKDRLDIVDVLSGYLKLVKAGTNYKGRCPFHNEKTPSFVVSPSRQSFYCFGCGMKGDMFTFVQEVEGLDFRGALKLLADKAGVELEYEPRESKTEKDKILSVLLEATQFYESELEKVAPVLSYLETRGLNPESIKDWKIGYAPEDWRTLYSHLTSLGFAQDIIYKAGLAKVPQKEEGKRDVSPYDVFRDRIMFPISLPTGDVIAFSGRAFKAETEPKYLNTPDTPLFTKSDVLYGLDKAKEEIRRKNYAVLVEGQMDLVLSHQAGVKNAVASSGTAFTRAHLERLKRLSGRIILAFDGDEAGEKAAEKSAILGLSLGMEVKIARLPQGSDPAEVVKDDPEKWKEILRKAETSIEYFLQNILLSEQDERKRGKLIEKKILPLIALLTSAIEKSHFISVVSKRALIREEVLWEDLKKVKPADPTDSPKQEISSKEVLVKEVLPRKTSIEKRLLGIIYWQENLPQPFIDVATLKNEISKRVSDLYYKSLEESLAIEKEALIFEAESYYADAEKLSKDIVELLDNLTDGMLREKLSRLLSELSRSEMMKNESEVTRLTEEVQAVHKEMTALEERRKIW